MISKFFSKRVKIIVIFVNYKVFKPKSIQFTEFDQSMILNTIKYYTQDSLMNNL